MKKIIFGMLAVSLAATTVMAGNAVPVKKAKQATCTSCPKGQQCGKLVCTKPNCCK